jgi:hypothetical protein
MVLTKGLLIGVPHFFLLQNIGDMELAMTAITQGRDDKN